MQGTLISAGEPISFHYTRNFRPGQSLLVEDELIACDADEAPEAYDASLRSLCTLTTDLSAVPQGERSTLSHFMAIMLTSDLLRAVHSANDHERRRVPEPRLRITNVHGDRASF